MIVSKGLNMEKLKGFQKRYLKGLAHSYKPVVTVGQKGAAETLIKAVDEALHTHELIKMKFVEFKKKAQKKEIVEIVTEKTGCEVVGMIGHVAILYRMNKDPEKRKIKIPQKA